jgi:glucose-1-phosphate thymidylyltransferase
LLDVAGKSVLDHIIDRLEGLPVTDIIFITGHLGEQFARYQTKYPVKTVEQTEQKGTAHAIWLTKDLVHEPVLIIFADTVFDADLSVINRTDADGIIWAKEVEDYQRFGVILHNDGVMQRIVEKPMEPVSKLANIGLYYFKDYAGLFDAIDHVLKSPPGKGGEYFLTDAFQYMVDHKKKIIVENVAGWYDCGTWDIMIETNKELLKKQSKHKEFPGSTIIPPVWIADSAKITNSVVGPNVSVGDGVVIENSVVTDTILSKNAKIYNAVLTESMIGQDAEVRGVKRKVSLGAHSQFAV